MGTTYYGYDELNRVTELVTPAGNAAYYTYDAEGAVTAKARPNGSVTYYAYDPAGRPESISHLKADGAEITYFGYSYTPAGNVSAIQREGGEAIYYSYDHRSRLTAEDWTDAGGGSIYAYEYGYDGAGNRTRKSLGASHTYYQYDETNRLTKSHRVPAGAATYYSYDPRGNTTRIKEIGVGSTYFQYNDRDLVESIHYGDTGTWNYFHYDAQGLRYAMRDSSGLRYFTWDEGGMNLLCERDASGTITRKYAHGPSPVAGIGTVVEMEDGSAAAFKYPHMDHRGTVFATTDSGQTEKDTYEWNAWGEVLSETESGFSQPFGYQSNWMRLLDSDDLSILPLGVYVADTGRFGQQEVIQRGIMALLKTSNRPADGPDGMAFNMTRAGTAGTMKVDGVVVPVTGTAPNDFSQLDEDEPREPGKARHVLCMYTGVSWVAQEDIEIRLHNAMVDVFWPEIVHKTKYSCMCQLACFVYDAQWCLLDSNDNPSSVYSTEKVVDSYAPFASYEDLVKDLEFGGTNLGSMIFSEISELSRTKKEQELAGAVGATTVEAWIGGEGGRMFMRWLAKQTGYLTSQQVWEQKKAVELAAFVNRCRKTCAGNAGVLAD